MKNLSYNIQIVKNDRAWLLRPKNNTELVMARTRIPHMFTLDFIWLAEQKLKNHNGDACNLEVS